MAIDALFGSLRAARSTALTWLRVGLERSYDLCQPLRSTRGFWLLVTAAVLLGAVIVTALAWSCRSHGPSVDPGVAPEAPRYLVVCNACGYREAMNSHPARSLERRGGRLCCPACGEPQATWFRRGGHALPPGGWATSQPAATTQGSGHKP